MGMASAQTPDTVDPSVKASPFFEKDKSWATFRPLDFGHTEVKFDAQGVRSLGTMPAPGVHPRMFFSPEDLPALRKRLKETRSGREAWKNVLSYSYALRNEYNPKADYAQPDLMNGAYGNRGRVPLHSFNMVGKHEDFYAKLAAGQKPDKEFGSLPNLFSVEALRCLVEDDAKGARKLAKATLTALRFAQAKLPPAKPGEHPAAYGRLEESSLGMIYDFIYNWMTPEQRQTLRDELVNASAYWTNYGTFNNAEASRSNWTTFSYNVFDLMAIEGEPGYNDLKYRGMYRGYRNFYTYSIFNSGAVFEGEGKQLMGLDAAVVFDRVAPQYKYPLLSSHPAPRLFYDNAVMASMLPTRDAFASFDMCGGIKSGLTTPSDVIVAHYLYPTDKKIDLLYRSMFGDEYYGLPSDFWLVNKPVICALFATDHDPNNTFESLQIPNTFFCGQRAMMLTRSSWDKEATFLTFHVRGASGGHPYCDRNGIMLTGKGRPWITVPYDGGQGFGWACDTVQFEGFNITNTSPGRMVDFVDTPQASFAVGDAKYCWDWKHFDIDKTKAGAPLTRKAVAQQDYDLPGDLGGKLVEQSFNDFAYTKVPTVEFSTPLKYLNGWSTEDGRLQPVARGVYLPVQKALRTAGIVRGPRPYVLIVDDIQRNALPTGYDWNLTMMDDLARMTTPPAGAQADDIILAGKKSLAKDGTLPKNEPALLIRVLDAKGRPVTKLGLREKLNILTISTVAVEPAFKVLLYPFRNGEPLPTTQWDAQHAGVSVDFPDQHDRLQFTPAASGKTDLSVSRDGKQIAAVTNPVSPLRDADMEALDAQQRAMRDLVPTLKDANPDADPNLLASWPLDKITSGAFPARQAGVPAIPVQGATVEPGFCGTALRISPKGMSVPYDLSKSTKNGILTVAFWIKVDNNAGNIININSLWGATLGYLQGRLNLSGNGNWSCANPGSQPLSGWSHLAITSSQDRLIIYRDGNVMVSLPKPKPFPAPKDFQLGGDSYGVLSGQFADLRIYKKALNADAVQRLYLIGASRFANVQMQAQQAAR